MAMTLKTDIGEGFWKPNPFDTSGRLMGALSRAMPSLQAEAVDIAMRRGFTSAQEARLGWQEHPCRQDGQQILGLAMTLGAVLRTAPWSDDVLGAGYSMLVGGILTSMRRAAGDGTTWRMIYPIVCDEVTPCVMEASALNGRLHSATMQSGKPFIFDDRQEHWTNNMGDKPVIVIALDILARDLRPRARP